MIAPSDIRRIESVRKKYRASASARLTMWRELAVLTRQYDIVTALNLIEEGYSNGGRGKPHLVALAAGIWRYRVENNETLGSVVNGWVTLRERMFAAVAHNRQNFGQIIEQMYQAEALLGRIKSQWLKSLVDPCGMILWTWAILIYFCNLVLSQFEQSPTHPKGWAITAMHAAHWILYWGSWLIPAVLLAIGLLVLWRMRSWLSRSRLAMEAYWPFSLYKALHAADFLVALSVLQSCGDDLPTSLVTMSKTADPYLLWQISALEPLLRTNRYNDATAAADRDFPDAMVNARLGIALRDHPKHFAAHLKTITDDFNAKLAVRLEDNAAATRFALVILIGAIQIAIVLLTLSTSLATY